MFGDSNWAADVAQELLEDFLFEEILELNDLDEAEVLAILIQHGFISQPERFFPEGE